MTTTKFGSPPPSKASVPSPPDAAFARASILLVDDQPARLLSYEAIHARLHFQYRAGASYLELLSGLYQLLYRFQ